MKQAAPSRLEDVTETLDAFLMATRRMTPDGELSRTAAATLAALYRIGPMRLTTLADHEMTSQPAMTGLIRRLEAAGLVHRDADPSDGRAVLVSLTQRGRTLHERRRRSYTLLVQDMLGGLDAVNLQKLVDALPALRQLTSNAQAPKGD